MIKYNGQIAVFKCVLGYGLKGWNCDSKKNMYAGVFLCR
jgi:hypothetical protein